MSRRSRASRTALASFPRVSGDEPLSGFGRVIREAVFPA